MGIQLNKIIPTETPAATKNTSIMDPASNKITKNCLLKEDFRNKNKEKEATQCMISGRLQTKKRKKTFCNTNRTHIQ